MLKVLPFDQRVNVVTQSKTNSVKKAPNIYEIQQKLATNNTPSTEIWPVFGPKSTSAPPQVKAIVEKPINEVDDLGRLKIAAIIAILSQKVVNFTCKEINLCAQQSMNQTEFDFQSAVADRKVYEHELSHYRQISHTNLVFVFKKILCKLLERFYAANEQRIDHEILNFVAFLDHSDVDASAHFTYTDHQFMLSKQYIYSALYDGQMLQFNTDVLQINSTRLIEKSKDIILAEENTDRPEKTQLQKVITQIQHKTLQIFQKYKLFHQLAEKCVGKKCHLEIRPIISQLCNFCQKENIWQSLKSSPIEYGSEKGIEQAVNLCSLAFASQSHQACNELQLCGFLDDAKVFSQLLDSGALEKVQNNTTRHMLLEKAISCIDLPSLLECDDDKKTFKRALWLLSLTVYKLKAQQQKDFTLLQKDCGDDLGKKLLADIYRFLEKKNEPRKFNAQKKKIRLFLLRLKQFHLLRE